MPTVKLPTGETASFPEGVSPEEMSAAIKKLPSMAEYFKPSGPPSPVGPTQPVSGPVQPKFTTGSVRQMLKNASLGQQLNDPDLLNVPFDVQRTLNPYEQSQLFEIQKNIASRQPLVNISEPVRNALGKAPEGAGTVKKVGRGLAKAGATIAESVTTPGVISDIAYSSLVPGYAAVRGLTYLPELGEGSLEGAKQTYKAAKQGDIETAVENAANTAAALGAMYGIGSHSLKTVRKGLKPKPITDKSRLLPEITDSRIQIEKRMAPQSQAIPLLERGGGAGTPENPFIARNSKILDAEAAWKATSNQALANEPRLLPPGRPLGSPENPIITGESPFVKARNEFGQSLNQAVQNQPTMLPPASPLGSPQRPIITPQTIEAGKVLTANQARRAGRMIMEPNKFDVIREKSTVQLLRDAFIGDEIGAAGDIRGVKGAAEAIEKRNIAREELKRRAVIYAERTGKSLQEAYDEVRNNPELVGSVSRAALKTDSPATIELERNVNNFIYGKQEPIAVKGNKGLNPYASAVSAVSDLINNKLENLKNATGQSVKMDFLSQRAGKTKEQLRRGDQFRGGQDFAKESFGGFMTKLNEGLNFDDMRGISEALRGKVEPSKLNEKQRNRYEVARQANDYIHEMNFGPQGMLQQQLRKRLEIGDLTPEGYAKESARVNGIYEKNKGSYVADMYDMYEVPEGVSPNQMMKNGKLDTTIYKRKKDLPREFREQNLINDPGYLTGKRLMQTLMNGEFHKYSNFIIDQPTLWSKTEKPGFIEIPDAPAYGVLSGKFVRGDIARDILGFVTNSKGFDTVYNALRYVDKFRQPLKVGKTVLNPPVVVSNIIGNRFFSFIAGLPELVAPKNKYVRFANEQMKNKGAYYVELMKNGVLGTDYVTRELSQGMKGRSLAAMEKIPILTEGKSGLMSKGKAVLDKLKKNYSGEDDLMKIAAFKALLDRGLPKDLAIERVKQSYQDYARVGQVWDVVSKLPVVGKPFVKFTPEMIRILTNSIKNNPLWFISILTTLKMAQEYGSQSVGETQEQRKIREDDPRSRKLFGMFPTTIITKMGEMDPFRWLGLAQLSNVNEQKKDNNLLSQLGVPDAFNLTDTDSDILFSPLLNVAQNKNWMGKAIYDKTNQTFPERVGEVGTYLTDAYLPAPITPYSLNKISSAVKGEPDRYGKERTIPQIASEAALGLRFRQFKPEDYRNLEESQLLGISADLEKRKQGLRSLRFNKGLKPEDRDRRFNNAIEIVANDYKDKPELQGLAVAAIQSEVDSIKRKIEADKIYQTIKDKSLPEQKLAISEYAQTNRPIFETLRQMVEENRRGLKGKDLLFKKQSSEAKAKALFEQYKKIKDQNKQNDFVIEQIQKGLLDGNAAKIFFKLRAGVLNGR